MRDTTHGPTPVFLSHINDDRGREENVKVMVPNRFHINDEDYPCIMVYFGTKDIKLTGTN